MRPSSWILYFLLTAALPLGAEEGAIFAPASIYRPVTAENGMIACAERHAAEAAVAVLQEGGNAMDAAVTAAFTMAVTVPRAGNLAGGGFLLHHDASAAETTALDFRETAPAAATEEMFLDAAGNPDPRKSRFTGLACGIPGTVAGLAEALASQGTISLERAVRPARRLAANGFTVDPALAADLASAFADGRLDRAARRVFGKADGEPLAAGERLVQPALAETLGQIAEKGAEGFYSGLVAQNLVATVNDSGGRWTLDDLADYTPVWRKPVAGSFAGTTIASMPPPSSGGVHLLQMLQLLEEFPLADWGPNSSQSVHILVEVMKRAYADRSRYLGDPDFVEVPVAEILSEDYKDRVFKRLNTIMPTASADIRPGRLPELPEESPETTHLSVVDAQGNAVALTYTLNFSFGAGIFASKAGVLLNNEMDDFSAKPGTANAYGLIGGAANAVAPGKRMLSSMSPTLVLRDGEVFLVTGSPGGSRIITTVLQVVLNVLVHEMNIAEAHHTPRIHHQWLPDVLQLERGFPADTLRTLRAMGYRIQKDRTLGAANSILRREGLLRGSADPRRAGVALGY